MASSFGARALRSLRRRLLEHGAASLPKTWQRQYIVQRILATPPWADMSAVRALYREAQRLTAAGTPHVVDHEIPLNHPYVCGLHIAENMRVVPWATNAWKSNRWHPDQTEMNL